MLCKRWIAGARVLSILALAAGAAIGAAVSSRQSGAWSAVSAGIAPVGALGGQLGQAVSSQSPGLAVGRTWFDQQHMGAMGRMIEWSRHGQPETLLIHFSWTYMPGREFFARQYRYRCFNGATGALGDEASLQSSHDFAGYVGVAAMGDGRAVVGGHNREMTNWLYDCQFYWDASPGAGTFTVSAQVPRPLAEHDGEPGQEVMWPKFRYQGGADDTVLQVLAWEATDPPSAQALYYFRKVGADASGTWDDPPYIVDTIHTPGYDVAADDNGKVALAWIANLPCPGDPCDTCSGFNCRPHSQQDNDLYCQISHDYGATWQPRRNVTSNPDSVHGYRPFADLSALITTDGNLHMVWNARTWPADGPPHLLSGALFHWSEDVPVIRAVHDFGWDQTACDGGTWQLNASKMTLSECGGKLYVVFVQFNDIPGGIEGDCASYGSQGYPGGAANGELYLTISSDGGATWDEARNVTESRTPGCDSIGGMGGPCQNDHWPSMARFGTDVAGDFEQAVIIVPAGSIDPGTFYLDVQYVNDHSAGAVVHDEGFWSQADIRWFRLACVDPVTVASFGITPSSVSYPSWTKHGIQKDLTAVIVNEGNGALSYVVSAEEDTGPAGWLSHSIFDGQVPSGVNNRDTAVVHLNTGGIVNDPGSSVVLTGRLVFQSNAPSSPDTLPISLLVTDTLYEPIRDTIHTSCLSLTVANTGNFGDRGTGRVNMDYVLNGDCDTSATVYLFDGSPVVGYVKGVDTIVNYCIYGTTFADEKGFIPVGEHLPTTDSGGYEVFRSGRYVTHDSAIAIEQTWYGPLPTDTCGFFVQRLTVYVPADSSLWGLRVGMAVDWDIPSDSGLDNGSGVNEVHHLLYQFGGEYHQDDSTECQDNDNRFGGMMLLDRYVNGIRESRAPHGAYTADNATYVYPAQGFVARQLYTKMGDSGFSVFQSTHPDSQLVDLHSVMTFDAGYSFTAGDTLTYYIALITIRNGSVLDLQGGVDGAGRWYCDHIALQPCGCCNGDGRRGNADGAVGAAGEVDVADLTYLTGYLFLGGPAPPCVDEANADGVIGAGGPVDIADLTLLTGYLFLGGPAPLPC